MDTLRYIRSNIFNPISSEETEYLPDQVIAIQNGTIQSISPFGEHFGAWEDYRNCLLLPGFIDLHTHLPQYFIRGIYYPALLPWLEKAVFPEEARFRDPLYARHTATLFFQELFRVGTTFSVVYSAPFREATEIAFEVAQELGAQAKIGMTLMDIHSPEALLQTTDYALKHSFELAEKWNAPLLSHILSPRFAPTCSENLMRELGAYARQHQSFIQSHLSENTDEIALVKELFNKDSYTAVYQEYGLLTPRSIMGHAIHLSDSELQLIKESGSSFAHCPDSNFYLKSGEYPYRRIKEAGIPFGLASDIGAGTSLNMLQQAKLMNYRQSQDAILPEELLYRLTLANARILELDHLLGSITVGKQADLLFFRLPEGFSPGYQNLSQLCFSHDSFTLQEVLVKGRSIELNE